MIVTYLSVSVLQLPCCLFMIVIYLFVSVFGYQHVQCVSNPYKSYFCCTTNLSMIFTEATYYIGVVGRMSSKPIATPETYSGEGHFDEWTDHFESVAELNTLKWLSGLPFVWSDAHLQHSRGYPPKPRRVTLQLKQLSNNGSSL